MEADWRLSELALADLFYSNVLSCQVAIIARMDVTKGVGRCLHEVGGGLRIVGGDLQTVGGDQQFPLCVSA